MANQSCHIALSLIASAAAFGVSTRNESPSFLLLGRPAASTEHRRRAPGPRPIRRERVGSAQTDAQSSTTLNQPAPLHAVIYGWDGEDDTTSAVDEHVSYSLESACAGMLESPAAAALAETLSYDGDHRGTLARLAVAFSPPGRSLTLGDIERVEVLCVNEDSIEIEAIVCEDGGCVSLAVPVSFPNNCGKELLEGCVFENLDALDEKAEDLIKVMDGGHEDEGADLDELCLLNSKVEYPSWWVPPECDADLVAECDSVRRLLNDGEFQSSVKALAFKTLSEQPYGEGYILTKAVIAAVGPAGICLKAQAKYRYDVNEPLKTLDVLVPFGGEPKRDVQGLRAAVLGAVMAAES